MSDAKAKFTKSVEATFVLGAIYDYLSNQVTAFDISEILRAQFVLLVSTLDFYIHEIVRDGVLCSFDESEASTGLSKIAIPLGIVKTLFSVDSETERKMILNGVIKDITSKHSYQAPHAIEKALALIEIKNVWSKLSDFSLDSPEVIKNKLALIVNRRNKIVHEADINFVTGEKDEIDKQTVQDCYDYLFWLVNSLDIVCKPDND